MKSLRIKTSRSQQESKSSPRQYPASAADTLTVESTSCVIQNIRKSQEKSNIPSLKDKPDHPSLVAPPMMWPHLLTWLNVNPNMDK